MNLLRALILLSMIGFLQTNLQAQEWVSYESQHQINDLVDTGNELHMATDAGLVVMDKLTLEKTIFDTNNSSLNQNHIQTITRAPNGNTWIGTYGGLISRFDGGDFQDSMMPEGDFNPNTFQLYDLQIAPNGDVWLGTSAGVFHKQENEWKQYAEAELGADYFKVWDIEIDDSGDVIVASTGVSKFANGEWTDLLENSDLLNYLDSELFFGSNGDIFLAGDLDRVARFDGEYWQEYLIEDFDEELSGHQITGFTENTDGSIYLTTQLNGVYKLENDNWILQDGPQFQEFGEQTDFFFIDEDNNTWLNSGIYISVDNGSEINSTSISATTLESNAIQSLSKSSDGSIYIMGGWKGIVSVVDTDGNWSMLPATNSQLSTEFFNDLLAISEDDIWMATSGGLHHFDGSDWEYMPLDACYSLTKFSDGTLFAQTGSGAYVIVNGEISLIDDSDSPITNESLSGMGIDPEGNLWLAAYDEDRIYRYSTAGDWTIFSSDEHPAINNPEGDFHFDASGNVWVPRATFGALRFDGTSWTNPFEGNVDLIENTTAHSVTSDASGKMYFSHHYGVTTLFEDEWENLIIDAVETNLSHDSEMTFDDQGNLWWASNRYGVFSYKSATVSSVTEQITERANFAIFPNPAQDQFQLNTQLTEKASVQLFIYNSVGQIASVIDLGEKPAGMLQETINVSSLQKGIYVLQLQVNGKALLQRLMKS